MIYPARRLKYSVKLRNEKTDSDDLSYLGLENIESFTGKYIITEKYEPDGESLRYTSTDVLFNKLRPYLAKAFRPNTDGKCTGELLVIEPKKYNRDFLFYLLLNRDFIRDVDSSTYGSKMPRANWEYIGNRYLVLPSLPSQKAIAAYLDRETTRIDALISKKKKQIELLEDKRQAIITRAITKGLDPHAKMKDSGVEWIGEIPEGWEVRRLKFVLSVPLEYGANESAEEDDPTFPRYIRITDFDDSGNLRDETFKSLPTEIAKDYLLTSGDILFARSGATVGKTFQYKGKDGKACFAGYLIRAKPEPSIIYSDYLYFFTKCSIYENWKNSIFIQATIQNIGADKYANLIVPVPPIPLQMEIASFLKIRIEESKALQERLNASIDLLREYRSSLITASVSGQIDVSKEVVK